MLQVCNYNINFVVMQTLSNCPCCSKEGIVLLSIAESESLSENQIHLR